MSLITPPLESLEPMPELIREVYSEQKFKRLKKDIAKRGVQVPLHGIKEEKNILIYDGIHRLLALRAVNEELIKKEQPAYGTYVFVHDIPRKEAIIAGILANDLQTEVNPVDKARYIQSLRKEGMKSPQIAKELNVSESHVRQMWMLLRLDEPILKRVKEGRLDYYTAILLLRINDSNERIVACEEIVKNPKEMTQDVVKDLIKNGRWGETKNVSSLTAKGLTTFCEICGGRFPYKDTRTKQICLGCLKEIPNRPKRGVSELTARKKSSKKATVNRLTELRKGFKLAEEELSRRRKMFKELSDENLKKLKKKWKLNDADMKYIIDYAKDEDVSLEEGLGYFMKTKGDWSD